MTGIGDHPDELGGAPSVVLGRTGPVDDALLRAQIVPDLPRGLVEHTDRVVTLADTLARQHGLDVARVRLAAQGHDLLRAVPPAELIERADRRGLAVDPVERGEPLLLHGPLAAIELAEQFNVDDVDVLHAVRWHTTGHPDYTPEAWAMFVADKVEPHKVSRRPALAPVRLLADGDLEAAALANLDLLLLDAVAERWQVHPAATAARNALLGRL
jgi:predicted HD superfamily hydrolase involved in NAD metabolism